MMRIFLWLLVLIISAVPALAEVTVGYTAEWLAHKSSLVAVATPQQIEEFKGEQGVQFVKIRYRLDDVLKGPLSTGDTTTVYHYNTTKTQFLASAQGKARQLLIFSAIAQHLFRDIDGKYVFTENHDFLSAYSVDLPVDKLFTPDFHRLTTYTELLKRSKAQIAYEANLEHQYWTGVITEKRIEVPLGSEAHRALYAGSASYLLVPDYQEKRTVDRFLTPTIPTDMSTFLSPWSQPGGKLTGRLRFELTPEGYFKVFTELKNEGGEPISISNHLPVTVEIRDINGIVVKQTGLPVDFLMPQPQTAVIPTWGVLVLRVDEASVAARDGKAVVQIGGQGWELIPGSYRISGTLCIDKGDGWRGTLTFPEVPIAVPPVIPVK